MAKTKTFNVGDRVRFSSAWLRSTCSVSSPVARIRGTVTQIKSLGSNNLYATVDWDTLYFETKETNVLTANLQRIR